MNDLIATGKMTVDGRDINTKLYLSGHDLFILLVLGFQGATSNYVCAQKLITGRLIMTSTITTLHPWEEHWKRFAKCQNSLKKITAAINNLC